MHVQCDAVTRFAHLLAPGAIGNVELRNRILMCPMGDSLAEADGTVSERQLDYFEARAEGGAALLLVGSVSVGYPDGSYAATQTAASHDDHITGLARLAARAHSHGARIAAQLVHDGGNSLYDIARGRPLLVPSTPPRSRPDPLSGMVTADELQRMTAPFTGPTSKLAIRVATDDDIEMVIAQFAAAAQRCVEAGFDAIEIHGGHGYLLDAFRSGYANQRDDAWGGTADGRNRLMLETARAVRQRVGSKVAVWMRLNAFEVGRPGGVTLDDTMSLAPQLVAAGLDALHVSAYASNDVAIGVTATHTPHEPGLLLTAAAAVRASVAVPVIAFGRLEPDAADAAIANGQADFVAMGRKLLADPHLPRKLAENRVDDIRPCIYQYRCIGNIFVQGSVACVANPETAREAELRVPRAVRPRRIAVAGGGPAGLEAARRLADSGHGVTLFERAPILGGRLALGARVDDVLSRFLGWLAHTAEASGVEFRLGTDFDTAASREFDDVVVATGAHWARPDIAGIDLDHVRILDDVDEWLLRGEPSRVALLGGGKIALSLAAYGLARGDSVTVIEPSGVFGPELGLPGRFRMVHDVEAAGADLVVGQWQTITPTEVAVEAAGETRLVEADTVIVAHGAVPVAPLAGELRAAGVSCHVIGDCREVARIEGAMLDAARLAVTLAG